MSTELESNTDGVALTRFWGGDKRGSCILVTRERNVNIKDTSPDDWHGHFSVALKTEEGVKEVRALAEMLLEMSKEEMTSLATDLLTELERAEEEDNYSEMSHW